MCILEREREHIGSIWSRVTCLDSPLAGQSLARQALGDSRSLRLLTVVIENKQYKKINKQYTKQYLMTNQTVPKDATRCYECVSARIT
jgi:predicted solute-binding protein